jgi:RNA polymerase sigma factor (sigma-70 family)
MPEKSPNSCNHFIFPEYLYWEYTIINRVSHLTDEKIMLQVREGQLAELAELFERYHLPVYHFFLKLTMDTASSEDLAQNLFCRIIQYRHSFNIQNGSFRSWIFQMARNLHADFCRQKLRIDEVLKKAGNYYPKEEGEQEGRFREHDFEKLELALAGLGPLDRELIVLSRYEGLKYHQIAEIKNRSVGSIKVQIHRALKELRTLYFKQLKKE